MFGWQPSTVHAHPGCCRLSGGTADRCNHWRRRDKRGRQSRWLDDRGRMFRRHPPAIHTDPIGDGLRRQATRRVTGWWWLRRRRAATLRLRVTRRHPASIDADPIGGWRRTLACLRSIDPPGFDGCRGQQRVIDPTAPHKSQKTEQGPEAAHDIRLSARAPTVRVRLTPLRRLNRSPGSRPLAVLADTADAL